MRGSLDSPFVSITGQDRSLQGILQRQCTGGLELVVFTEPRVQVQMLRTVLAQCFIHKELSHI